MCRPRRVGGVCVCVCKWGYQNSGRSLDNSPGRQSLALLRFYNVFTYHKIFAPVGTIFGEINEMYKERGVLAVN